MRIDEREHILQTLQNRLWQIEGIALVERNLRKAATADEVPSIFILEGDDDVLKYGTRPQPEYFRDFLVVLDFHVSAPSEDEVFMELAKLRIAIKNAMHAFGREIGTTFRGAIRGGTISGTVFPDLGNVVGQSMEFVVQYVEKTGRV